MDYRHIASSYNELHEEEQLKKLNKVKEFLENNKISLKNKKILDIGSGTGISTKFFGNDAIGIESEIEMIKQGSYNAIEANAENLPFNNKTFDVVVSFTAIHNFKDPEKALLEIRRVLKPKYFLVITVLKRSNNYDALIDLINRHFKCIEINEEKDTILISTNIAQTI